MNNESAKVSDGRNGSGWHGAQVVAAAQSFLAVGGPQARREVLHTALELHRLLAGEEA
jgi:hypothetical protein